MAGRWYHRLAVLGGLTDFGAPRVVLKPGAWSAQRHWHIGTDELAVMIAGAAVLVDDTGEQPMRAGDVAAFLKDDGNGHLLQNRSDRDCVFVAVGGGDRLGGDYPDIDMRFTADGRYLHDDGSDYGAGRA